MPKLNINGPFFQFMNTLAEFILLNVLFILFSLPIFTIGASLTALFSVSGQYVTGRDGSVTKNFFKAYKQNFGQGVLLGLIFIVVLAILVFNLVFWNTMGTAVATVIFVVISIFTFLVVLSLLYVFPLQARFKNTLRQTLKNALIIALENPKMTILLLLINAALVLIAYFYRPFVVFCMIFGCAFIAYGQSYLIRNIWVKYEK